MTHTVTELRGEDILALDGPIGSVKDAYFDDQRWALRYLVVDTGRWLPGRQVLISPASIDAGQDDAGAVHVKLTREQVKSAPGIDSDQPVSRRQERALAQHMGYPYYWSGPMLWGLAAYPIPPQPAMSAQQAQAEHEAQQEAEQGDSHLRSCREVIGYDIEARDGAIGEVEDFVVDEQSWAISDVVVDTRKWWPGGEVRVHPQYVERIDWRERKVHVRLTRDEVRRSGAVTPRR